MDAVGERKFQPYGTAWKWIWRLSKYTKVLVYDGDCLNWKKSEASDKNHRQTMPMGLNKWGSAIFPPDINITS